MDTMQGAELAGYNDRMTGHDPDAPYGSERGAAYRRGYNRAEAEIAEENMRQMAVILAAENPKLADVPFSLQAEPVRSKAKQGGLF